MLIGYARTSTADQTAGFGAQLRDLKAAGADKVFSEKLSAKAKERPQLEAALDFARDGDCVIVTKLDRLARSTADLLAIVARLEAKGVSLRVMSMQRGEALDTATATGKLMLTVLGAVAEFERTLMLERQLEGIAAGKAAGHYKGRVPTARNQSAAVLALKAKNVPVSEIARRLNMSRMSVYRILGERILGEQRPESSPAC